MFTECLWLNVYMLSVVMLNIVLLSVVVPDIRRNISWHISSPSAELSSLNEVHRLQTSYKELAIRFKRGVH
jgi:hypothetical protein